MNAEASVCLAHPTGNTFSRALIKELESQALLHSFHTTIGFTGDSAVNRFLPKKMRRELGRRTFETQDPSRLYTYPCLELFRHLVAQLGWRQAYQHENAVFSFDRVAQDFDKKVSRFLEKNAATIQLVYAYEDAALESFRVAQAQGIHRIYDLPIAYWKTASTLLSEERERCPEWAFSLVGVDDSVAKRERKDAELALAECVVCPSAFVADSLPSAVRSYIPIHVIPFGSPQSKTSVSRIDCNPNRPLKLLFAGTLGQRKGLGDLFAAMRLLNRSDVELHLIGTLLEDISVYRKHYAGFIYEPTRPHAEMLELMGSCDVLVLPSIVEGRALVMQEALSMGLPLIITPNTGGADLVNDGAAGFLVPIRSPEAIAEKIAWFADNREQLESMRSACIYKAQELSWRAYQTRLSGIIHQMLSKSAVR
jgi:glycosyltransferase involved in cell wall biosynthesis